jgi:hypothetical protein
MPRYQNVEGGMTYDYDRVRRSMFLFFVVLYIDVSEK